MGYGLGIDLGTTFTAAAVSGESGTRVVQLGSNVVAPSVVFARPDGKLITGDAAEAAALTDPARVSRGHKRRLGDPTPLVIGGVARSPQALLAAQLRDVVDKVVKLEGAWPGQIVLTCPAVWGPYRREQFDEVPKLAGLSDVRIVTEPEAAAMHYSVERRLGEGELVAVYDLGGGTFDTTILRARADGMEILGTPEGIERMGGMDFDDALMAHVDDRLDGAIGALDPGDPADAAALLAVRANCVRAKEELSHEPDVAVVVPLPSGEQVVRVTRVEFNDMIRPSVSLTTDALHRTITSAGLLTDDLSGVLLAGGSSRIPLVPQAVSAAFGKPVRVSLHPKFTVALGAAAMARATRSAPVPPAPRSGSAAVGAGAARAAGPRMPDGMAKWVLPAAAAVVLLVLAATLPFVLSGSPEGAAPEKPQVPNLEVYDGKDVDPYRSFIGSEDNWSGTEVAPTGTTAHSGISATRGNGVRIAWNGTKSGQFYLQSPASVADVRPFAGARSAIEVDLTLNSAPAARTVLAVHCRFPCSAEVNVTPALQKLPIGKKAVLLVPTSCFQDNGLDSVHVNTPFLLSTAGSLDLTVERVRWVAGAEDQPGAARCGDLR